uniref:Uncharacterized protein n=1 Tax=Aplanochytrium stocchinoi TaxID=215587 RepID=A0A7S3PE12_9STRA
MTPELEEDIRAFFKVYDPQRLDNNFDILRKYINAKGFDALEAKLMKKYGANISTMKEVKEKTLSGQYTLPRGGVSATPVVNNFPEISQPADYPTTLKALPRMPTLKGPPDQQDPAFELDEMSTLPPPPPPVSGTFPGPNKNRYSAVSGMNPITGKPDNDARLDLYERFSKFYQRFNPARLNKGIGDVVDYALTKGEEKINIKLMKEYGYDLNTFMDLEKEESQQMEMKRLSQLKEEEDKAKHASEDQRALRNKLIKFFLKYDPPRAEMKMDVLLNFAQLRGIEALNEKMFNKYGADLEIIDLLEATKAIEAEANEGTINAPPALPVIVQEVDNKSASADSLDEYFTPEEQLAPVKPATLTVEEKRIMQNEFEQKKLKTLRPRVPFQVPSYTRSQLEKYFAKYEPASLSNGGVDVVYQWTQRNGMALLNEKLLQKYGMSLQEFNEEANALRDDLIEFYRVCDRNKLVTGCEQVLNWGLKNGRAALNVKLMEKYGMGLHTGEDNFDSISTV